VIAATEACDVVPSRCLALLAAPPWLPCEPVPCEEHAAASAAGIPSRNL
jgi:hypothetical protein